VIALLALIANSWLQLQSRRVVLAYLVSIRSPPSDWECYANGTSLRSTSTNTVGI
jgi:hypothetical protein